MRMELIMQYLTLQIIDKTQFYISILRFKIILTGIKFYWGYPWDMEQVIIDGKKSDFSIHK